jgi:hypothetical protein
MVQVDGIAVGLVAGLQLGRLVAGIERREAVIHVLPPGDVAEPAGQQFEQAAKERTAQTRRAARHPKKRFSEQARPPNPMADCHQPFSPAISPPQELAL